MSEQDDANFTANLRAVREARGWSQIDLVNALMTHGVSINQSAVSRIEKGEREATAKELRALAQTFGVPLGAFWEAPAEFNTVIAWSKVAGEYDAAHAALSAAVARYLDAAKALESYLNSERAASTSGVRAGYDSLLQLSLWQHVSRYEEDWNREQRSKALSDPWKQGDEEPPF